MKDRELTRLLQTHPEEGLEAAMLAYAPLVKAVLNRILPQNPCDREECMADVFVSLWRNAAKLDHTATPLRPWLIVTRATRASTATTPCAAARRSRWMTAWPKRSASWLSLTAPPPMPPTLSGR